MYSTHSQDQWAGCNVLPGQSTTSGTINVWQENSSCRGSSLQMHHTVCHSDPLFLFGKGWVVHKTQILFNVLLPNMHSNILKLLKNSVFKIILYYKSNLSVLHREISFPHTHCCQTNPALIYESWNGTKYPQWSTYLI